MDGFDLSRMLGLLRVYCAKHPYMRFGQAIENIREYCIQTKNIDDLFYIEDSELYKLIRMCLDKEK